ncbi:MAG: site-2 protease family protein [Deltaproteobacteria bacterium]|nr:site-2 protease family protein [Deltaproteobacteria bacterium]
MYAQPGGPSRPHFTIAGIPVTVSMWHVLLMGFIFYNQLQHSVALGVGAILIAIFSVLMHEMGHALVSARYGLAPRVELNGMGGVTMHAPARGDLQVFFITSAGPAANFALAGLLWAAQDLAEGMLAQIVWLGMAINVVWGLYNLLPVLPLDGGTLTLLLLRRIFRRGDRAERIAFWLGIVIGGAGAVWGLSTRNLLVTFVLGMAAFENWRALKALGAPQPDHDRVKHGRVRELLLRAREAYANGDFDGAARACHQARSEPFLSTEEMKQVWSILALTAARQAQWSDAIRYAERDGNAPEMAQVRAVAILALGEPARARAFLGSNAARLVQTEQLESLRALARSQGAASA